MLVSLQKYITSRMKFFRFKNIEVVCGDRCGRNTQMFDKKFITINNHQSTIYTIHTYN